MVPDPVKRKARDRDLFGAGDGRINRLLANVRKHQNDRVRGELTPRELRKEAGQNIKTTQQECFPDEIQALEDNKPNKSTLLKIAPKLFGGLLRSIRDCDIQMFCLTRRSFQSSFQRITSLLS